MAEKKAYNSSYKWVMLTFIVLTYIFTYAFVMTSLSTLLPQISVELGLDVVQQAAVVGALPLALACFTFVVGVILDKSKIRIFMFIAVIICAVAILMRGMSNSFGVLYAAMFLLGVGQAFMFPGCNKVISMWFKREEVFKAMGVMTAGAPIGMIVGYNFTLPFSSVAGWGPMYVVVGVIALVVALLWLFFGKEIPNEEQELNKALGVNTQKNSVLENLKVVLSYKQTWMIYLGEFFWQGSMQTLLSFGVTVLITFPGVTAQLAGTTSSMGNLGSLFGYFILPPISERTGLKKPFIWCSMLFYAIIMPIGLFSKNFIICGACFFIGSFFNGWAVPGGKSMMLETPGIGGLRAGTAIGGIYTMQRIAAALFPFIYAAISKVTSTNIALVGIVLVACLIACVFFILTKETGIGREAAKKLWEEKKAAKLAGK